MCGRFTASMSKTSPSRYPLWVKQPSCTGCVKIFSLSVSLSLSLSLSLSHTHTHTHTHHISSNTILQTHTLSLSLSLSLTHTHTHTLTLNLSLLRESHAYAPIEAGRGTVSFLCLALSHSLPFFLPLSLSISQVRLVGASFALNQIRKMMGMALAGVCLHVCCMYVGIYASACMRAVALAGADSGTFVSARHACMPLLPTRCACVCIHQRPPTSNLETNWSSAPRVPGGAVREAVRGARTAHTH